MAKEIELFRESILEYKPKILISFGAFPFEFVRRIFNIKPEKGPKYWSNSNLNSEFERAIENFDINQTNRIPILRQVSVSSKFEEDHRLSNLTDISNYFRNVGAKIADKIIENKDSLNIWIE
ncbi:Uracil phosphoribosyltransferase [Desulfosporosinus metallidurans]|uniref:Uracil phosphoribosyltransferase n=1 Tax=Desulfosporosinus metallidurans TaxID=1888891 RepID=A0A1Q8QK17_9FIRM|nr:Uracil phosphoribosyltransferase [Desulfosporosinus metallidurans]